MTLHTKLNFIEPMVSTGIGDDLRVGLTCPNSP